MKDNIDNIGNYLGNVWICFSGIMFHTKIRPLRGLQKYLKIAGHWFRQFRPLYRQYQQCQGHYLQQHSQHKSTTFSWDYNSLSEAGS